MDTCGSGHGEANPKSQCSGSRGRRTICTCLKIKRGKGRAGNIAQSESICLAEDFSSVLALQKNQTAQYKIQRKWKTLEGGAAFRRVVKKGLPGEGTSEQRLGEGDIWEKPSRWRALSAKTLMRAQDAGGCSGNWVS